MRLPAGYHCRGISVIKQKVTRGSQKRPGEEGGRDEFLPPSPSNSEEPQRPAAISRDELLGAFCPSARHLLVKIPRSKREEVALHVGRCGRAHFACELLMHCYRRACVRICPCNYSICTRTMNGVTQVLCRYISKCEYITVWSNFCQYGKRSHKQNSINTLVYIN